MKRFSSILCTICATVLLGACSYFDAGEGPDVTSGQSIDLMQQQANSLESTDLVNITNGASDGSVTVYSLDGPSGFAPSSNIDPGPVPGGYVNPVHAFDPSVEVFPLDDAMGGLVDPAKGSATVSAVPAKPYEAEPLLPNEQQGSHAPSQLQQGAAMGGPVSVYFGHDSTELSAEAAQTVAGVSKNYKSGDGISVEGHASVRANYADEIQKRIVNLRVSMNRALAVAAKLIAGGVPADSIQTVAWGDAKPVPTGTGMDAEAASRRVDIYTQSLQ